VIDAECLKIDFIVCGFLSQNLSYSLIYVLIVGTDETITNVVSWENSIKLCNYGALCFVLSMALIVRKAVTAIKTQRVAS
jgi:hypothetical protein